MKHLALALLFLVLGAAASSAHQPFATDDAEVTPRGRQGIVLRKGLEGS